MVFSDYMNSLSTEKVSEKKRKIIEIAEACLVQETIVYNWIAGRSTPDPLKRKTIAGVVGIPEQELFPDKK